MAEQNQSPAQASAPLPYTPTPQVLSSKRDRRVSKCDMYRMESLRPVITKRDGPKALERVPAGAIAAVVEIRHPGVLETLRALVEQTGNWHLVAVDDAHEVQKKTQAKANEVRKERDQLAADLAKTKAELSKALDDLAKSQDLLAKAATAAERQPDSSAEPDSSSDPDAQGDEDTASAE